MFSILMQILALAPAPCPPQSFSEPSVGEWLRNTATVTSRVGAGYGLVVGSEPGRAWVAVPRHVVFGTAIVKPPWTSRDDLKVKLFSEDTPRRLCPGSTELPNPRPPADPADLTFVCVEYEGTPVFNRGLTARILAKGDSLRLTGPGVDRAEAGTLERLRTPEEGFVDGGDIGVRGLVGVEGYSGALTVAPSGVAGLYLGQTDGYGRVLSIGKIKLAAESAKIPWDLVHHEFYYCGKSRQIRFIIDQRLRPPVLTLKEVFTGASLRISPDVLADVQEGKYRISALEGGLVCEPQYMILQTGDGPLEMPLKCAPRLDGTWVAADGDDITCVESSLGVAQCAGLARQGLGYLQGTLSAKGRDVTLTGAFSPGGGTSYGATGRLTWSAGRLEGTIQRAALPPLAVALTRRSD